MLDTGRLSLAGIDKSENPLLQEIWSAVQAYNRVAAAPTGVQINVKTSADALDRVAFTAGAYLTSKPPQPKMKNRKRWNALRSLAEQIGPEASRLGIRLLKGPANYQKIEGTGPKETSYWLERLDPQHRPSNFLSGQFYMWLRNQAAIQGKKSFWETIGTVLNPAADEQKVKYYPLIDPDELSKSRVAFENDILRDEHFDAEVHTEDMETHFTGKGWGIFVCSPARKLFVHSHQAGGHHHSSFLAGGAVMAAGEIVVEHGVILAVTSKSGHYQPTAENILNFVRTFRQIPGRAVVQPDLSEPRFQWCWQLRDMGLKAPALKRNDVLTTVPVFAHSDRFKKVLAKIPD